ncbi:Uncharacterised protein [Klebsiella pneumoniae]|nr:Uncharacterised protein [Klebsiella pneumoniae]
MLSQGFGNHAEVWIAFFHAENRRAAHTVKRLKNDVAVFLPERFQLCFIARNQRFWR